MDDFESFTIVLQSHLYFIACSLIWYQNRIYYVCLTALDAKLFLGCYEWPSKKKKKWKEERKEKRITVNDWIKIIDRQAHSPFSKSSRERSRRFASKGKASDDDRLRLSVLFEWTNERTAMANEGLMERNEGTRVSSGKKERFCSVNF